METLQRLNLSDELVVPVCWYCSRYFHIGLHTDHGVIFITKEDIPDEMQTDINDRVR